MFTPGVGSRGPGMDRRGSNCIHASIRSPRQKVVLLKGSATGSRSRTGSGNARTGSGNAARGCSGGSSCSSGMSGGKISDWHGVGCMHIC